nr:CASP-like protein 1E1 [Tanacetum cinerariifolium]
LSLAVVLVCSFVPVSVFLEGVPLPSGKRVTVYIPPPPFLVIANCIACAYSVVSMILVMLSRNKKTQTQLAFLITDLIMMALLFSANGAATSVGLIGVNGNSHTQWQKVCYVFKKYCHQGAASIAMSFLGSFAFLWLVIVECSSKVNLVETKCRTKDPFRDKSVTSGIRASRFEAMANEGNKNVGGASGIVVDENRGREESFQGDKRSRALGSDFVKLREDFKSALNVLGGNLGYEIHDLRGIFMREITRMRAKVEEEWRSLRQELEDLRAGVSLCKRLMASRGEGEDVKRRIGEMARSRVIREGGERNGVTWIDEVD